MQRGLLLEIDLDSLIHNLNEVKRKVRRPVIAVVKADAYGHGAVEVARTLVREGVDSLAVAFISEAIELRESGINACVLVLFDTEVSEDIIKYRLVPVVNSLTHARELSRLAQRLHRSIDVHLNIDTGMGRTGINSSAIMSTVDEILSLEGLRIKGLMTHFPEADSQDRTFSLKQIEELQCIREFLASKGINPQCHAANSHAVLNLPESYFDAVRPGIMLYGAIQSTELQLKSVMTVKSRISEIRRLPKGATISYGRTFITTRDTLVGVIPAGYADGIPRSLSNNFCVLVRGTRVPIIGRVCMDLTMVELTDMGEIKEGEEVVLIGSQDNEAITADEMASAAGTISYEILTSVGRSANRIYRGGNAKETG